MGKLSIICVASVIALLAACERSDDSSHNTPVTETNAELVRLCERADLQDFVLDDFVEAAFKRSVANAGIFGSIYDQGLSEEKVRQETSIENARAKRHSIDQVDCTIDFVADVSSDNKGMSEIKFSDAQYSLVQQSDNSYRVVPKKATFFANVFIDGMSRDAWNAEARSTQLADDAETGADNSEAQLESQYVEQPEISSDSEPNPAPIEE